MIETEIQNDQLELLDVVQPESATESKPLAQFWASQMARWFVQGDYCYIAISDNYSLLLQGVGMSCEIPFAQWSGEVVVEPGVLWATLTIYGVNDDELWSVHGLNYGKATQYANVMMGAYHRWAKDKVSAFDNVLPAVRDVIKGYYEWGYYLRDSDYQQMRESVSDALASCDMPFAMLESIRPRSMELVNEWLDEDPDYKNLDWQEQELEKWSAWFDKIESSPLNESQRLAALVNQDHNLILAGAGSGKTSVLVARAGYLVESGQCLPDEILMLAFGRDAANEMSERLAERVSPECKASTFHRLAMQVIKAATGEHPQIGGWDNNYDQRQQIMTHIIANLFTDEKQQQAWKAHIERWPIPGLQTHLQLRNGLEKSTVDWLWQRIGLLQESTLNKKGWREKISYTDVVEEHRKQALSELNLLWPFLTAYRRMLKQESVFDFNALIDEATRLMSAGKAKMPWKVVMVDEYQDISPQRLAFIEAITQNGCKPSLFAVGDDWQAIYRFAGSDVSLTTDFATRYPMAHIGVLDTTYRFNSMLGEVANQFVLKNPSQLPKELKAHSQQRKKSVTVLNQALLETTLSTLAKQHEGKEASVLFLGRTHGQQPPQLSEWQAKWPQLQFDFKTCHSAKGKEADFVFILNVERGIFPFKSRDAGLMKVLQFESSMLEYPEERRLFYVAMTRAKKQVWVCASPENASPFVNELIKDKYPIVNKLKRSK
uniref:DNA helicase IV n=1 Tax=Thaumasiovibrio occultus TaxID=1891184 RepID=UPI00131D9A91|nr:DNA helicase IV [Thaumasiovibrio occultus]